MAKWIQSAIKHPGAFKRSMHVKKVTGKVIAKGLHSRNPLTRKRAALAKTLAKLRRKR